ncbi:MAG: MFS transporter [Bacillota bacterium]|nr:MFS transporter [Bacillota bacterium]
MRELLQQREFARLLAGRVVTTAGDSFYAVASMWLVQELTHSTFYTGLAGTLSFLPYLLQMFTGPIVDRWPIRRTLVVTQGLQGLLVLTIPLLALAGRPPVWAVLALIPLLALVGQFGEPAEQASMPRILDREHLVKANSAFTFAYQGTNVLFRALAGLLVVAIGAPSLYAVDALSFALAALIFSRLRVPPAQPAAGEAGEGPGPVPGPGEGGSLLRRYFDDLREGLRLVLGSVVGRMTLIFVLSNFAVAAMWSVLPQHAATHGGAGVYGALLSAMAAGVILGALLAPRLEGWPLATAVSLVTFLGGLAWLTAAFTFSAPLLVFAFGVGWVPTGVVNALVMGGLQRIVPASMMGRVAAAITSLVSLAMPVGSFVGGVLGQVEGPSLVVAGTAVTGLLLALYWVGDPILRKLPATRQLNQSHLRLRTGGSQGAPEAPAAGG